MVHRFTENEDALALPEGSSDLPAPPTSDAVEPGFRSTLRRLVKGRPTLSDVWLLLPPLGLLIVLNFTLIRPNDFWWHLRTGQIIFDTGVIPTTDLFSFTRAAQPWTNQGWLMQVILFLLYRAGGLPLIIFFHALTIVGGYVLVEAACLRSRSQRAAALATLAAAAIGVANWNVRPQSASFLFFGLLLFVLERHRTRGGKSIWVLPGLFALWVNLHGGFIFGMGLLGIYGLAHVSENFIRRRASGKVLLQEPAVVVASILALSLNPSGPIGIVRYVLGFFRSDATQNLNIEFMPLNLRTLDGVCFFGLMALFILLMYRRPVTLPPYLLSAMFVFGFFALYSRRVAPWFGFVLAPAFAQLMTRNLASGKSSTVRRQGKSIFNNLLLALLGFLVLLSLPWWRSHLPVPDGRRSYVALAETPIQATQELCRLSDDVRVFNDMGYGSYLIWACPQAPVFIDTRIELYSEEMWQDYLLIINAQFGWEDALAKYGVNTIFARKDQEKVLVAAAKVSGQWQTLFEDEHTVLLRRVPPSTG